MKQAVLEQPGQIRFTEQEDLSVSAPDEVLIAIQKIGICGSDIHAYKGKHPFTPFPVIQGHEYSGRVVAVGSAVTRVKPGDRVTGRPQQVCGKCGPCRSGRYNVCSHLKVEGFQAPGAARDLFILPEERTYPVPDNLSYDEIALIEPAAVAAHATSLIDRIEEKQVVITGAGPIGNLIAQFAKMRGAKRVIVSDFNPFRLQLLREMGISDTIHLDEEDFDAGIQRILGDSGFEVGIEAVGAEPALHNLVGQLQKGGELLIVGVYEALPRINMGFVGEHELTIKGSMMYKDEDYRRAIEMAVTGKIKLKELITHRFDFKNYNEAYAFIEQHPNQILKVLIDVN
ncbi:zinc-binding alcohol dehydrogenase family protein [Niabella terrae]